MRNSLKKIISVCLIIVLAASMVLSLNGCHKSRPRPEFEIPEKLDESKKIEIVFWAKNDTNIRQTRVYENAIKNFEALYPNITVKMKAYTDYNRMFQDVMTNIPTNTMPDVVITYPDHVATYLTGENLVVPLDELMADERYGLGGSEVKFDGPKQNEMITKFLDECIVNGKHYAIPYMRSSEALYINKTYVEAMGFTIPDDITWDFVWEVSKAATEKNEDGTYKVNGQTVMIPFIYKSTDNMMIQMLKQLDGGYSDDSGNVLIFNDTTKKILDTVLEYHKIGAFDTFDNVSYPGNFFNAGQCILAIDSTAGATWMGSKSPLSDIKEQEKREFETVVREIPQFDVNNKKMISQGPSLCVLNSGNPQQVLAAWLFTQFMLTNEVQTGYAKTEGYVPVTLKAQQSEEYLDYISRAGEPEKDNLYYDVKIAASKIIMANTENTFITPVFNGSTSVRGAAGELIETTLKTYRRGQEVNYEKIFNTVSTLKKLDQIGDVNVGELNRNLGKMPNASIALLVTLVVVWIGIGVFFVISKFRKNG